MPAMSAALLSSGTWPNFSDCYRDSQCDGTRVRGPSDCQGVRQVARVAALKPVSVLQIYARSGLLMSVIGDTGNIGLPSASIYEHISWPIHRLETLPG
jgi:hypothetical protein